jgi:hypothetical protein
MKKSLSLTSKPMPWEFRPLRGTAQAVAYLGAVVLMPIRSGAVLGTVIFPIGMFMDPANASASAREMIGWAGLWLGIVALAVVACRAFVVLNRPLDLPRHLNRCPAGSVCFLGGSVFRSFSGAGGVTFDHDAMLLAGWLGPPRFLPLVMILAYVVIAIVDVIRDPVAACGPAGILHGSVILGLKLFAGIYERACTRGASLAVAPPSVASVRCRAPIIRIRFKVKPVEALGAVTILIPPDQQVEFFRKFDRLFPGKLPRAYREALRENSAKPAVGKIAPPSADVLLAAPEGACPPVQPTPSRLEF